jgi:hypothetical protein
MLNSIRTKVQTSFGCGNKLAHSRMNKTRIDEDRAVRMVVFFMIDGLSVCITRYLSPQSHAQALDSYLANAEIDSAY